MMPYLATLGMLTLIVLGFGLFVAFCLIVMLAFFEASDWLGSDAKGAWFVGVFILTILAIIVTFVTSTV